MPEDASLCFLQEMANVKDEHLHIMRGHLLIEKKLRELLNDKVVKPDALSDARLTFTQVLCIVEALYWKENSDWLWQQIRKLNNIRNSLSHQLDPKKYDEAIKEYFEMCVKSPNEFGKKFTIILAMYNIYKNLCGVQKR